MAIENYKGWSISHVPKPIPNRSHDWEFVHQDYDGPPDDRFGFAPSLDAARAQIDQHEDPCPESV